MIDISQPITESDDHTIHHPNLDILPSQAAAQMLDLTVCQKQQEWAETPKQSRLYGH